MADVEGDSSTPNTSSTPKFNNNRKADDENCVPRLIDNKRRHLEKRLSQSQRDEILLREAKEESLFKTELCQAIKDSNKLFADAMTDMSKSFMLMAETMNISMKQIAMIQQQQQNNILWYLPINKSSFSSLFSTTSTAKTDISYHEQCTSTKYNEYTTTNNVNERITTHNECTATNNELTKRCNK